MKTLFQCIAAAALLAFAAAAANAQALGQKRMADGKVRRYWDQYVIRCGDRVFLAVDWGEFYRITEYRGEVRLEGVEFVLEAQYAKRAGVEEKGALVIRMQEARTCQYSPGKPGWNTPWSPWETPFGVGGQGIAYTRRRGKVVPAEELVRLGCEAIAAADAFRKK